MTELVRCDAVPEDQLPLANPFGSVPSTGPVVSHSHRGGELSFETFFAFWAYIDELFKGTKMPDKIDIRSPGNTVFELCGEAFYKIGKFKNFSMPMPAPPIGPETNKEKSNTILRCMLLNPTDEEYSREQFRAMNLIQQLLNH